jgi:hypothetical protein
MLDLLSKQGPALHGIMSQGKFEGVEDGRAVIRVSRIHETFIRRLESNGKREAIREVVSTVLKQQVGVRFELEDAPAIAAPATVRRQVAATPTSSPAIEPTNTFRITDEFRAKLYEGEPLIRAIVDQLGGTVVKFEE